MLKGLSMARGAFFLKSRPCSFHPMVRSLEAPNYLLSHVVVSRKFSSGPRRFFENCRGTEKRLDLPLTTSWRTVTHAGEAVFSQASPTVFFSRWCTDRCCILVVGTTQTVANAWTTTCRSKTEPKQNVDDRPKVQIKSTLPKPKTRKSDTICKTRGDKWSEGTPQSIISTLARWKPTAHSTCASLPQRRILDRQQMTGRPSLIIVLGRGLPVPPKSYQIWWATMGNLQYDWYCSILGLRCSMCVKRPFWMLILLQKHLSTSSSGGTYEAVLNIFNWQGPPCQPISKTSIQICNHFWQWPKVSFVQNQTVFQLLVFRICYVTCVCSCFLVPYTLEIISLKFNGWFSRHILLSN